MRRNHRVVTNNEEQEDTGELTKIDARLESASDQRGRNIRQVQRYAFLEEGIVTPPTDGAWVDAWQPGPAAVDDVRRRIPPSA
jgi:hypothetical protein